MIDNNPNSLRQVWFAFAINLIVLGFVCYGVYWIGIASGRVIEGILISGISFFVLACLQGYTVFRKLRDPDWKPEAPPFQIDSDTYSRLTIAAKMLFGSPLNLLVALSKALHRGEKEKSESDKNK